MILGIGVDIIEIERIQKAVDRWGEDFLRHVFTPQEIDFARKFKFPYAHYAGRFAAKEAVFKALGKPEVSWQDLNITNDPQGKPQCAYLKDGFSNRILLTISHSRDYAVAQAVVTA